MRIGGDRGFFYRAADTTLRLLARVIARISKERRKAPANLHIGDRAKIEHPGFEEAGSGPYQDRPDRVTLAFPPSKSASFSASKYQRA
jgi:hypothetical protein